MKRVSLIFLVGMLGTGCSPSKKTVLMSLSHQDTKVEITALSDWEAADGNIEIFTLEEDRPVKVVAFARSDDYVDDVRAKVSYVGVVGERIIICLKYASPAPDGVIFRSPAGVTVEVIDESLRSASCMNFRNRAHR